MRMRTAFPFTIPSPDSMGSLEQHKVRRGLKNSSVP